MTLTEKIHSKIIFTLGKGKCVSFNPLMIVEKKPQTHKICGRNCQRKIRLTFILSNLFTPGQFGTESNTNTHPHNKATEQVDFPCHKYHCR